MTASDYLVVVQILATILMSGVGFLLKNVIQSNLEPIKTDINGMKTEISGMKNEIKEINSFLKEHKTDQFAHPQMIVYLEGKFVSKAELDALESFIRMRTDKGRDSNGDN